MSETAGKGYSARVLHPADARLTYPLAALKRPELTLDDWRRVLRKRPSAQSRRILIGIANAAGCIVAVLHWNGVDFDTLASAPAFMLDESLMMSSARAALGVDQGPTT